jgi:chromosome partitioning protein
MEASMISFNPSCFRNESEVESKLIVQYLLPKLGYAQEDWHQEVALGSIRLDFLAFAAQVLPFTLDTDYPLGLVIEAKSPRQSLDSHVRRLKQYLTALHTNYGLLTNGKDLRIYERFGNDIRLIFHCSAEEIVDRVNEIKNIVGKDFIKERQRREKIAQELSTKQRGNTFMKVIAIYHNKGGVGKTTVSVNLAAALRKKGYNVLLIDLDSQANSTFAAGLVKFQFEEDDNLRDNNVFHILKSADFSFIQDVSRQSNFFNTPEVDVVPSHISLIGGQYELNQINASKTRLIKKLKKEESKYDFVIIDTPPSRDIYAQVAIIAANYLIIPSDLKPFANQGLSSVHSFVKEIDEFRDSLGRPPIKMLGVLPSKISTNAQAFQKTFPRQKETIIKHYNLPVMDSIIFDRVALSHCLNQTVSVGDLEVPDPKSIFDFADKTPNANQSAEEFENLATEILAKMEKG